MMTNTMTPEQLKAAALARRARLLQFHTDYLAELREAAPAWVNAMDECMAVPFDPKACELLAETSPDDGYLRGYFFGQAAVLHRIQALTERTGD